MSRGGAQTQSRGGGGSHTPAPRWRNDPRSKLDVRNTGAHPFASDDLQGLKSPPTPDGDQLPPGIVWCPLLKMAAIIRAIDGTWGPRLCFFAYPSRSERIFSFLYFSLWGPCFPFFSILYEMVFRDIFLSFFFFFYRCPDFYIRWRYTNVGDTGAWSCLREYLKRLAYARC